MQKKDHKTAIDWGNQVADKYVELDEENKCIQDDLNRFQKDNNTLNDEIKRIQYSWIKPPQKETISSIWNP